MRAEEVIATHGNTDFDAFAAMLAARRLYPNAVACVAGSLNRNVRELARLHADELDLVELPDWVNPETAVLSRDGALTTTLVGVLAERELAVTPLEATVFALGIHEDTGSLTYPSTTQRDAEALAWCLRHGALQDVVASFLHTPLSADDRRVLNALLDALETHEAAGIEILVGAVR